MTLLGGAMLKHVDITTRRISKFIEGELAHLIYGERKPLSVEFCPEPHATQNEAKKGPWQPVEPGYKFGPAYRTVWFKLKGKVPKEFAGEEVIVFAEVGGERTVWENNSPTHGVDGPHRFCTWIEEAKGGESVEVYVQSYTRNAQVRVTGREPKREELVETVGEPALSVVYRDVQALYYDAAFAFDLMGAMDQDDPAHETILRALNDVCNVYASGAQDWIARSRKIIRDALGSLNGELKHAVTPVGHAHLDTAWLWPLEITHKKMAHTTATQLDFIEKYPEYVFSHSQASQYEWLEKEYPVLFERVKKAVKQGQWEPVGSMWVEADCNVTGGESLVRQFLYGRRYFRNKLGFETHDMWLPDVFGYSAALPQILAKFNIDYFTTQKISWNQFNTFPHHTFWWQGIDGTKIWSHFPPVNTYCGDCTPKELVAGVKRHRDKGRSDMSLYMFGHGDGGGGPEEKHLEFLRRARVAPGLPEVASGKRAIDFFKEAKARSKDLLTWSGELYFELHRGTYTSQAAAKKGNRVSEFLLRDAELLSCFAEGFPKSYPAAKLEEAWKLVLLNQFHDIIPGSSVNEVYVDAARDYAKVAAIGEKIVEDALKEIGGKFDTSEMSRPVALFQNSVFGSQGAIPWNEKEEPVSLAVGDDSLPVQVIDDFGDRKLIFPTPEGALGSVAIGDLSDRSPEVRYRLKASNRKIENDQMVVRFDANGNITSVESLEDGCEFIESGKAANMFQILDDKPLAWSAWDVDVYSQETAKDLVKSESFEIVERGPVRVAARVVKRVGKSVIRQTISLGPTPGIRFDTEVDWHEDDKMLKVAFPVNVNSTRATFEVQFGNVERSTHMNTSWDMARFEVCAQKWVDLSEADQGVALINDCKYGYDVQGNVMRLTLLRSPKAPDPECDMGVHRFTYVLYPHFGPYNHAGVVAAAYAVNAPVRSAFLEKAHGESGSLPTLVSCDDRNLVVETVKKAEDDDSIIVRVYECHNGRGPAELYCVRQVKRAWLCDLEEKPITELEIVDGVVMFEYKPFEIITIKLSV
jgi:alpha-mannosidase